MKRKRNSTKESICLGLLVMGLFATGWAQTNPPSLKVEGAIKSGEWRPVDLEKSTRVISLELKPKSDYARLCLGLQFTTREIPAARIEITLLDNAGKAVARCSHTEELGPEVVRQKGKTLDLIRRWNDVRAIWIDLPKEAENAARFMVEVRELNEPVAKESPSKP